MFTAVSSTDLYFASFVYPLRVAVSHTDTFTFVDYICLLSDILGTLCSLCVVKFEHKHISQIWHVTLLLRNYLNLIADI